MKPTYWALTFVSSLILAGCSSSGNQATLGQLRYKPEREKPVEVKAMDHQEVRAEYEELLHLFEDEQLKEQIQRRIADVYMMEGVQNQNKNSGAPKSNYLDAIKSYRDILEKYPDSPDNAEVLYQLAKAYDMEGDQDEALKMMEQLTQRHPYYPNIAEAWFRMGDIYFGYQRYAKAEQAYSAVTKLTNEKLWVNAHYMLAWTQYKQYRYRQSIESFAFVLNSLIKQDENLDGLAKAEQSMASDTLHSVILSFDKIGGAGAIESIPSLANRAYIWLLYSEMGDYYLGKELYEESAESYRAFVLRFADSTRAPSLHEKLVATYLKGGFPKQALDEKTRYVSSYGIHSNYSGNKQASTASGLRADIEPVIKLYLEELAQHNHATGQDFLEAIADVEKTSANDSQQKKKRAQLEMDGVAALDVAAGFYQEFIDTFAADSKLDQMRFLKAEALFLAKRYQLAAQEYELVAYHPLGSSAEKQAANAGYAAIVCYENIIDGLTDGSKAAKQWQALAVESMLRFSQTYDSDSRSPTVLTTAAETMFSLDQYQRAIDTSTALIANDTELDLELKKTAFGIMAHSHFKLQQYTQAEDAYLQQRNLSKPGSEEFIAISERLASSIYRHAQDLETGANIQGAADYFLKIKALVPNSKIRATAQYEAVALLLSLKQWNPVITELKDLITRSADHEMAVEFPRQLAYAYEQSEQWALAAEEYLALSKRDPDAEVKREALFAAALMYEKNTNHSTAVTLFKRYANAYEQPFETRMEARYHMATNYQALDEEGKKLYWLRRIIDGDSQGGAQRTERSRWLAAWANREYGEYFYREFKKTRLRLPLVKSLPRKKEMLESAQQRYQAAADYGFLEFVTESSFKIGDLYQMFANQLMAAPVPAGMSSSDTQTYQSIIAQQAQPLTQLAAQLHTANLERAWSGEFNEWIEKSFAAMRELNPARFAKDELIVSYGDEIR